MKLGSGLTSTFVKVSLVVIIILLVGFLGFLTGFVTKIIPETTTTTVVTTQPTTVLTTVPTTTQIEVVTTAPEVPCSPCFSYFRYVDNDAASLHLKNGQRAVTIGGVFFGPNEDIQILHKCEQFPCDVTVDYIIVDTDAQHTDTATLYFTIGPVITIKSAYCIDNQITATISNEGDSRLSNPDWKIDNNYVTPLNPSCDDSISPGDTATCEFQSYYDTINLMIIGPRNQVSGPVTCEPAALDKTITILSAHCGENKLTLIVSNEGNTKIDQNELKVVVDGTDRTDEFIDGGIEPKSTNVYSASSTAYSGKQIGVDVVGPINHIVFKIWCT